MLEKGIKNWNLTLQIYSVPFTLFYFTNTEDQLLPSEKHKSNSEIWFGVSLHNHMNDLNPILTSSSGTSHTSSKMK